MCLEYTEHDDVELKVLKQQGRTTEVFGGGGVVHPQLLES